MFIDLSTTPIAQVLRRLSSEQKSGDLQVRSARIVKTIFFDRGRIVFAASNLKKDRLGESLVALGQITQDDFARAQIVMKEPRRRLGEALVRTGALGKDDIGRAVARQVRRIALSLFEFDEGAACFEERPCIIPLEFMVSLSIHRLLYDGIQQMREDTLILAGLGDLDRQVKLGRVPHFRFAPEDRSDDEMEILRQAQRRVTLRRLAWTPGGVRVEHLRAVYALLASGVLQEVGAEEGADEPQPSLQTETGNFLLSTLPRKPEPSAREAMRMEVSQELERSAQLDHESWLKVSRSAPPEELARVIEDKMERYHALLDACADDQEMRTDIELILGRAASMLRLARHPAAGRAGVPAGIEPRGPATRPAASLGRFPQPLPVPVGPVPVAPVPAAEPAPEQSRLAQLTRDAEMRMSVADYAKAVDVYQEIVELAPEAAPMRISFAVALACHPPKAKQAEREFLEAIRLDPNNSDYHYKFGLYYKTMRERARAIIEMRAALSLNPQHPGARAELTALSPKDPVLTSLSRR